MSSEAMGETVEAGLGVKGTAHPRRKHYFILGLVGAAALATLAYSLYRIRAMQGPTNRA
jgi:hypothetical protein